MTFRYEKELENAAKQFIEESFHKYDWQVPLYNRVIDLVALDNDMNIIGIEFKLRDWKKALQQLRSNSNSFDYMYICIPEGRYLSKLKKSASEIGAGVMIYNYDLQEIEIVLNPKKNNLTWEPNIRYIRDYIAGRD